MTATLDDGTAHAPRARIVSRVSECYRPGSGRPLKRVRWIVVHRCSLSELAPGNPNPVPDEWLDAPSLSARFADLGLGTGGRPPYHGLTTMGEVNEQALPLSIRGAHAGQYNSESIGWCVVGRDRPASHRVLELVSDACAMLVLYTGGAEIVGHSDLPGGSADPAKRCPYPVIDVAQLRAMVRDRLPSDWRTWGPAQIEDVVSAAGLVV